MKNKNKIWLVSFLCVGAGIVTTILGVMMGGQPEFYIDGRGVHSSDEKAGWRVEDKEVLDEFTSAKISVAYANLEIIPSDEFAVEYALSESKKPICSVKEGELIFKESSSGGSINFGFTLPFSGEGGEEYVRLYVPEDTEFKDVYIETENGDIKLSALKAENLVIDNEYGDIKLGTVKAENYKADMENGTLKADNFDVLKADIQNEYGDVKLGLVGDIAEYGLDLATEYGEITVPGYQIMNGTDEVSLKVDHPEGRQLKIDSENGDISLLSAK